MASVVVSETAFPLLSFLGLLPAFLGPLFLAFATDMFDNQRAGMATILVFFVIGMVILKGLPEPGS